MLFPAHAAAPEVNVRKLVCTVEDVWHDNGPRLAEPLRRGSLAAVLKNPYAGRYVEDIQPMMEALKPLGREMAARLVAALGGAEPHRGLRQGRAGRPRRRARARRALARARRLRHARPARGLARDRPSTTKIGAAGSAIDVPIHHRVAAYVRSHFDSLEVRVADAPRPDEMLLVIAMTTGPRPHERVGGLRADEIAKFDGQR